MKLIKYLFTIPFSPQKNWKKALKLINDSVNLKEDVLLLFLVSTFLSIVASAINIEWYSAADVFMQIVGDYLGLIFKFLLLFSGLSLFGGAVKMSAIPRVKLISILFLTFGLLNVTHILINKYFYYDNIFGEDMFYYLPWYYYGIKICVNLFSAYLLVVGLLECPETSFKSGEINKNYGNIILFFIAINVINYFYDFIFSNFILTLLYGYY